MADISKIPGALKLLNSKRGYKSSITSLLNKLSGMEFPISNEYFKYQEKLVNQWLLCIDKINNDLIVLCSDHDITFKVDSDIEYYSDVHCKLAGFSPYLNDSNNAQLNNSGNVNNNNDELVAAISSLQSQSFVPKLQCVKFSGQRVEKFEFKNFLEQFNNCSANIRSDSAKLSYLRSLLYDYAFSIISHLTINDANFTIAIDLLKAEFLDTGFIVDEIFSQLINSNPKYDTDFTGVKQYIARVRADLYELQSSYNIDFISANTPGNLIVSHLVFSKIPNVLKREIVRICNSNYPSINQIFDCYQDVIKIIIKTSNKRDSFQSKSFSNCKIKDNKLSNTISKPATLENFTTNIDKISLYCKFCVVDGHSMVNCKKFTDVHMRKTRCSELDLCQYCTSDKHCTTDCYGLKNKLSFACKFCKSRGHISALCNKIKYEKERPTQTNICLNAGIQENLYLLPIIRITIGYMKNKITLNCLMDSGSQRSYFSKEVLKKLNYNKPSLPCVSYEVKTFVSSKVKELNEVMLDINLNNNRILPLPVLIDDNLNIEFTINDFRFALQNFKKLGINLAADYPDSDQIVVNGLIGCDLLQFMGPIKMVRIMNGSAWQMPSGICPFGNILGFLHDNQITPVNYSKCNLNYKDVISQYASINTTLLNFVLEPKHSYNDPLDQFFDESSVERKLDKMFEIENLDDNSLNCSNYDKNQIDKFTESIEFINNTYYVRMPWIKEKLKKVPSNYGIALAVLDKVCNKLDKENLFSEYLGTFLEQENEGIIERFEVDPENYGDHIWLPHRPIIRKGPQVTTKMRAVFNCSLKTKGNYSLNEAAYKGVNLMKNLWELIMLFRTNKYCMMGDIRRAFLMIKLSSIEDKNKFCFFMRENGKLIMFRYRTILFGFNASPFILNYIIKFHLSKYPNDLCNRMLNKNMYVDNVLHTGNTFSELHDLYKKSIVRMQEGNFNLRSWNSNSKELRQVMINDGKYVEHGLDFEKVLGYSYNTMLDYIIISNNSICSEVCTKRSILSQISKIFDPLSLTMPVTIRGKFLMKQLWSKKYTWDQEIDDDDKKVWSSLSNDLKELNTFQFIRNVLNTELPCDIYIFCDASKLAYGFVAYAVQNGKANIIMSKAKVSPMKAKSLPTLELLGVFTAVNCLGLILDCYSDVKVNNVFVAVDAQVVLSWLLTDLCNIKTKNKFTNNRLKDIQFKKSEILTKYSISIKFKYVSTSDNPADMMSRGLSLNKFKDKFKSWVSGPKWLNVSPVEFPTSELNCLSENNKSLVQAHVINKVNNFNNHDSIVSFDRFSSFNKLVKATSYVFKFVNLGRPNIDEISLAKNYLIKIMQSHAFSKELEYLNDPSNHKPTDLVRNLNLFLDGKGLIRSEGRISKTKFHDYNVIFPIILAKNHPLTRLIIINMHEKCKHLGLNATLTKIRLHGFWIPKARQCIKKVLSTCFICKKYNSIAFKYPKVTNLPKSRVNLVKPFLDTGIDYTGHLFVKNGEGFCKMYLIIFTCLHIRAVHIEIVSDMSTKSFLQALIRFTNSYGIPSRIYSDNARSFQSALGSNIIHYHLQSKDYSEKFEIYAIKHIRIPMYAPWVGATWERMIKVIKSCMFKSIGRLKLDYFELYTLISDIQLAINQRPLTYRCSSDTNLEIITPNSFLRPDINTGLITNFENKDILVSDPPTRLDLVKTLENRENLLQNFKDMWANEYLLGLRETCKDLHELDFDNKIKCHDVVMIKNSAKPRPFWLLGRVVELYHGEDNKIRSVKLKRGDGAVETHSIKHLFPLELSITHDHHPLNNIDDSELSDHSLNTSLPDTNVVDTKTSNNKNSNLSTIDLNNSNVNSVNDINSGEINKSQSANSRPKRKNAGKITFKNNPYMYY